jgi:hypothetical protein
VSTGPRLSLKDRGMLLWAVEIAVRDRRELAMAYDVGSDERKEAHRDARLFEALAKKLEARS